MTKNELKQYRSIVSEIDEVNVRINRHTVRDAVVGSDREFPYIKHTMIITGVGAECEEDVKLREYLVKQRERTEKFIHSIGDSETRRIFYYRYIDGESMPTWQCIAFKIGRYDESYPRRKHNEYMKRRG